MTRSETVKILERVCRLYVTQARKLTDSQRSAMLGTWAEVFASECYGNVDRAISDYMRQGKPFMPEVADIINILNAKSKAAGSAPDEGSKLFRELSNITNILLNGLERKSIIDPGGPKWDDELNRYVYCHPEILISTRSFTQYDFNALPDVLQEYAEDIEGLKTIGREIQSNPGMARRRFEMQLPSIKAELKKRKEAERSIRLQNN